MHPIVPKSLLASALILAAVPRPVPGDDVRSAPAGQPGPRPKEPLNRPPVLRASIPALNDAFVLDDVRFRVTATDPDGDLVTLRLLNPPPGLVFAPARDEASPIRRTAEWSILLGQGGVQTLVFEAHDDRAPEQRVRLTLRFLVYGKSLDHFADFSNPGFGRTGDEKSPLLIGDVTGDGVLDVLGLAHRGDVGSAVDTGKAYVWAGGDPFSPTPVATLVDPAASLSDHQGDHAFRLADLTGDGIDDVVTLTPRADRGGKADVGVVQVYAGGSTLTGTVAPTAVLETAGSADDRLGFSQGQGIYFRDLTGDGVLDVLVVSEYYDVEGTADVGALHLWAGGAGLTGSVAPTAFLHVPGATAGDRLGASNPESVRFADVDGDGVEDIVVLAELADVGGVPDTGAIYVWSGAAGFSGQRGPDATLYVSGASPGDYLGEGLGSGNRFELVDLTGDGTLDVLAGSTRADRLEVTDTGAFYLWAGGPGLAGPVPQTATFAVPGAGAGDRLGHGTQRQVADVTGDGIPDLVAAAPYADLPGETDAGAAYVWVGGAGLTGVVAPVATLSQSGTSSLSTTTCQGACHTPGVLLEDVDEDGIRDVLVVSPTSVIGPSGSGVVLVWSGGASLDGTPAPTAILTPTQNYSRIGGPGRGLWLADLTGNGHRDVIAASPAAGTGITGVGAVFVWEGAPGFSGTVPATTTFKLGNPHANDQLTNTMSEPSVILRDLTGDGFLDVLTAAPFADVGGIQDSGAAYVFRGGPQATGVRSPIYRLRDPQGLADDQVGYMSGGPGAGLQLVDVDDDGILDVVVAAPRSNRGTRLAGRIFAWKGGDSLSSAGPDVEAHRATLESDLIGYAGGQTVRFADVTGDGALDLVVAAMNPSLGVPLSGGIFLYPGPLDADSVLSELSSPSALPNDFLTSD